MNGDLPRTKDKTGRMPPRRLWMGLIAWTMLTVLMMTAGERGIVPNMNTAAAQPVRSARTVMYVQDMVDLRIDDDSAGKLDQLNYAFALIEDGRATGKHWQSIDAVTSWLRRHPAVDGVLSVGGWGADGFSDAASTAEGRKKLADSILALMDAHGFVGVDIDWEYPGSASAGIKSCEDDAENWYALLAMLRQGLDERSASTGRKHLLSVALGAGQAQIDAVDGARLDPLVDQAVIMAYDLRGFDRQTGHHAGLYSNGGSTLSGSWAVEAYCADGLASEKLLLGIPAYGRVWRRVPAENDGLHQRAETSGNRAVSYDEAVAMLEAGAFRGYDEEAQAAWLYDGSSFVSYEDEASITAKARWLTGKGLLGAAMWELGQDPSGTLLDALCAALTEKAE